MGGNTMFTPAEPHRFTLGACPFIFSLLALLAVLVTPMLTALPVYADWGTDIRLTDALGNSKVPSIDVSGNTVHVVWSDSRDGNDEIYYARSTDGGTTWGANIRLTNNAGNSTNPYVAVSGNTVHVVWHDDRDGNPEIYYKRSTDGGTTWGADTRLTDCLGNSYTPSIAVSGNIVHVAWHDSRDGNEEIYYKRSTDGGTTWGTDTRLTNAARNSALVSISVSGNNVHVAWQDERVAGNWEIYYNHSTDGGNTWVGEARLTNTPGASMYPSIAVSGNNVHVVWQDNRAGNFQIYYKRSIDGGTTWDADTSLVISPELSEYPSIAVSGNNVHVAWQDNRGQYYPRWEIYYKLSTDSGATWGADTRLTNAPENSEVPSIAVSGNYVHVAWQDFRDLNYEIYYKKYTPPPIPSIISINPTSGTSGIQVVIIGTNFTGATSVSFGGIPAAGYTVISATQIIANTGAGNTGKVTVTTPFGTATSVDDFTFGGVSMISAGPHGASMPGIATPTQIPIALPSVSVTSASLSDAKVSPGTPVIVTANVANTGKVNGSTRLTLYVNGHEESSRSITVNRGSNTPVTFTLSRNEPGTYSVYVGGTQAGSFTVDQFADSSMILYISGALILFAFAIGVIYVTGRRQPGR
jgi:hypothetical protein